MDLTAALRRARPGAEWALSGNDLSGLSWLSPEISEPTQAECDAAWAELEAERVAELEAKEAARLSARARLKSQGFTDAEIDIMYPTLAVSYVAPVA